MRGHCKEDAGIWRLRHMHAVAGWHDDGRIFTIGGKACTYGCMVPCMHCACACASVAGKQAISLFATALDHMSLCYYVIVTSGA